MKVLAASPPPVAAARACSVSSRLLLRPVVWVVNTSTNFVLRPWGIRLGEEMEAHSEEELRIMITSSTARLLTRYNAWANRLIFDAVAALPEAEATRERQSLFRNMVHTLNHNYVIDRIWQAYARPPKVSVVTQK